MDDQISRKAALDSIDEDIKACERASAYFAANGRDDSYGVVECTTLLRTRKKLEKLPSAQPGQRWIPVTERLPEEDTKVIVSCTDDPGDSEFSFTTTGWHYKGMWLVDNERSCFVRAWMPLPKSYSERRQDG